MAQQDQQHDAEHVPGEPDPAKEVGDQSSIGYRELIRGNRDFCWLWGGQIVSLLGDWFNMIASVSLIAALTESGMAVGGLFVVRMLAPFLTSPLAGVAADRYNRRTILIVADIARGLAVLGMLWVRSSQTIWLLYALTAVQLGISSFFFTARNAILPDLVEPRALGAANAIGSVTWSVMLAMGAALGGFAAGALGVYAAFLIDAATFFVSAVLVARIQQQPRPPQAHPLSARSGWGQYVQGLRYLAEHPDIWAIASHKTFLALLLGSTLRVVQVAVAEQLFPIGKQGGIAIGLMFAANGVGTGVGPLLLRAWIGDRQRGLRWSILAGYLVGGVGLAVSATLASFPTMLVGAFLAGWGNGLLWVFSTQLLLQRCRSDVRGRVFGMEYASFALGAATGSAAAGWAIDSPLGLGGTLHAMSLAILLPAFAWTLWLLSRRA